MAGRKTKSGYDGKIAGLYDLEETIGQGHFAVVKLARHVFTGEKVAVKVIDKQKLDDMSRSHLFQEVRCMKLVQHPNVVRLYEVIDTQTKLYLILELGDGDMYDYIMRHDSGLNEALAKKYFRQIVEAITYCHRLHVVHRDLKPENVVFFDKLGQVKLTDFGFSNVFAPGKKLETSCGSLAYSAPEILLGDSYDPPAVDVWSLGVILFMLVAGHAPFQEANDSETLTMIMDCKYQIPAHVSDLCRRLITKMLVREPSNRINLTDIEGDPWLSSEPDYENHRGISLPLLTREHISEDDHSYVVQKMVEGKICTRDEIYLSLEKNAYDHVAATYYLLVERRLRKLYQQQEMMMSAGHNNQANNSNRQLTNTGGTGSNMPSSAGSKPHLEPLMLSPRPPTAGGSGGLESKESNLVQSLLSPLGTHPSPVSGGPGMASPSKPMMHLSPADFVGMTRKCSLIHEESHEDEDDDFDMDPVIELKPSKSLELLDERVSDLSPCTSKELGIGPVDTSSKDLPMSTSASPSSSSPSSSSVNPRRPLKSVCSSPQLLNQIHEENESEDDDDFVPLKLSAPRGRYGHHHTGLASPEILRKYEQRRRRGGTGSRGTSCSSSDASDTDDTDGRSRKDKLKHKFVHRRDSSDHSSDTDGPSGNNSNGGGGGGGGSRISSGNGARAPGSRGGGGRGGNGSGGGGGNSGGGSSDKGGKGHNNNHHSRHHQNLSLNNRLNRCANTNIYNDSNTCESGMEKVFGISFSHHSLSSEENDMISPDLAEDDADHCNKEIKGNLLASLFSSHDDVDDDDEDDDTDLSKEDRRIPSHRKSSDINNSSDHRNSMNSLYSRNNNSSSSGSSYKHRRNHLARQKQIISSKNNEKEDEVVCGLSGTITDNIAMDISEKDIGIDLADFGSCLDDSLSIDLLASAIDCHRVAIEHDTADGRLCSSVKNERFDWMGKSELNNQENNKSNAGDNEKAINKNSDLIMTVVDPNNDITLNSTAAASSPLLTSNNYNDSDNNNGCNEDNISSNLGNHYEEYKNNNNNDNSNLIRISDYFNNVVVGTKTSPLPPPSSSSSSSSLFYNMEESTGVGGGGGVHFTDNGKLSYCTCNLLLKEGSNLVGGTTMSHIVDCEGSHLTLKCQQCASLAMDNTKNNNKNNNNNNNNNCLQPSSYCKAGPGSVMVQMESKCCSVV